MDIPSVLTEASRSDVGGDENASVGHAELVQDIVPVLLVLVSVDGQGTPASTVDRFCYFIDLDINYYEDFGSIHDRARWSAMSSSRLLKANDDNGFRCPN